MVPQTEERRDQSLGQLKKLESMEQDIREWDAVQRELRVEVPSEPVAERHANKTT